MKPVRKVIHIPYYEVEGKKPLSSKNVIISAKTLQNIRDSIRIIKEKLREK